MKQKIKKYVFFISKYNVVKKLKNMYFFIELYDYLYNFVI